MPENPAVHGIHHVTAIAGSPQENLTFYAGVLGMRLVKRSVNQDDPGTYHLFYADAAGTPGTDLTFFPWTRMAPSRRGTGMVGEVALAVPAGSLDWWRDRLAGHAVDVLDEESRFGEPNLPFADPHGLRLTLVGIEEERRFEPWSGSPVPVEHQIRGIHAVRIQERVLG
ncbi:MAG TPA: VOC family protein, partial [Gemmatimonadota bacterium]|nr:VOC family protein [Gemmatimonadota bacterium]